MRKNNRRGGSGLEFALLSVVWLPLMLGTLAIGSTIIRSLGTTQLARDAGHMYARGVNFHETGSKAILSNLAAELGTLTATGSGRVIFSTLTYVGRYQCKAAGFADTSTPPNPTSGCKNYRHFVFTHRWNVGNTNLPGSNFGAPTVGVNATTGVIDLDDYVAKTENRADAFTLLPAPQEAGNDGYQAGNPIFMVEARFKGTAWARLTSGMTYAFALF